jgi:hypothetical protein
MWVHLTVRAYRAPVPLTDARIAAPFWASLRRTFPVIRAAVLMPSHPHLQVETSDPEEARRSLAQQCAALRRRKGPASLLRFEPVPEARILCDVPHGSRDARYILLNPVRAGLVDDPLAWPWSTLRDVVGAVADPWVTAPELARSLERAVSRFFPWFHEYVTTDPDVPIPGRLRPQAAEPTVVAIDPLGDILAASAAALRLDPLCLLRSSRGRTLFVQLAARHGWRQTQLLSTLCKVAPRTIRWHRARPADPGLDAAAMCLGDPRLRRGATNLARSLCREAATRAANAPPQGLFLPVRGKITA